MAAAAVAFVSCQVEDIESAKSNEKTVKFVAQSIETKTAFGAKDGTSYPTLWTENDSKVKISLNYASCKDAVVTPSGDFKSASFETTITDDESGNYTFYSLSPAAAYVALNGSYYSWNVDIPTSQIPTATSVDESAQILVAKSATYDEWPTTAVTFDYSHVTAYGKMSLVTLDLGGATITSVALTAAENWAGRWYYYTAPKDSYSAGDVAEASASKTITINTSSTSDIWFACAPVDLSGKSITVTVNTSAGPFEKEITWPAAKPFESGKVYKFGVDMAGVTSGDTKVYTKVTSLNDITVDSDLIIVAADYDYAMSTTQNTNNRGQAAVTKEDNTIKDPGANVQIFKAKAGSQSNTIAFYDGANYIYAASSSANQLKSKTALDDNASFSLDITDGVASLTAQGSNTRNALQYNKTSNIFSCYTGGQQAICIYKLDGSGTSTKIFEEVQTIDVTGVTMSDASATIAIGEDISLTATVAPADATNKNVSWTSSNTSVATVSDSGVVTGVAAGSATITVTTEDGGFTANCTVTVQAPVGGDQTTVSIDYTAQGYSNQQVITDAGIDSVVSVTFANGSGSSGPKYYTSGTAIRAYAKNTITVSAPGKTIVKIDLTYGGSDGSNAISADSGNFSSPTWTGSASSVTFTIGGTSGNRRIAGISVTYE